MENAHVKMEVFAKFNIIIKHSGEIKKEMITALVVVLLSLAEEEEELPMDFE